MKARVLDERVLASIMPAQLIAYLRATGWTQRAEVAGVSEIWTRPDEENGRAARVPLQPQFADYAARVGDVLDSIEATEGRSQLSILHDLRQTTADLIRFGAEAVSVVDGTVPLKYLSDVVESARRALRFSAAAAIEPRASYPSVPQRVEAYVRALRVGQTELGSYVVTVLAPVEPEPAPQEELVEVQPTVAPFGRRVTTTFVSALSAIRDASLESAHHLDFSHFREAVPRGVSADLCDAIVRMSPLSDMQGLLRIGVSWSPLCKVGYGQRTEITLPAEIMPLVEDAANALREEDEQPPNREIHGVVTQLSRRPDAEMGTVTVRAPIERGGPEKSVVFELPPGAYHVASTAHDEKLPVVVSGDVVPTGVDWRYELLRPVGFRVDDRQLRLTLGRAEADS